MECDGDGYHQFPGKVHDFCIQPTVRMNAKVAISIFTHSYIITFKFQHVKFFLTTLVQYFNIYKV